MPDRFVEPDPLDWEGHWLNPVAFAQQWYEEHPEALKGFDTVQKMKESHESKSIRGERRP
jgi:hypothetical protein